jgi:hypothetical protein
MACLKAIEYHEKQIEAEWAQLIHQEMNKKHRRFLFWVVQSPAKTQEEAVKRITEELRDSGISKPGLFHEGWRDSIKEILEMCRCSDRITLNKEDYKLIGYWLPKTNEKCYRS